MKYFLSLCFLVSIGFPRNIGGCIDLVCDLGGP